MSELMFSFDIETLDIFDSAVMLSMSAVVFDPNYPNKEFSELLDSSFFVKLDAKQQLKDGRTRSKGTIEWWKEQSEEARIKSFRPDPSRDVHPKEAVEKLERWLKVYEINKKSIVWTRGSLDFPVLNNLCVMYDVDCPILYSQIRDARTGLDVLSGSKNGYPEVSIPMRGLVKHDPVHDAAMDAHMLMHYEEVG